jgi:putative Mg2+ transporter-C (MgtC) family protein
VVFLRSAGPAAAASVDDALIETSVQHFATRATVNRNSRPFDIAPAVTTMLFRRRPRELNPTTRGRILLPVPARPTRLQRRSFPMPEIAIFALNIGAALVMGLVIGLERQFGQHQAGLRTNALVCVGAALFVSLGKMAESGAGTARVASYVVSGLGFLGGGVILREGFSVRGLNTAATLWCTGAVGALAGAGLPEYGAIGVASILVVHLAMRPVVNRINASVKGVTEIETLYRMRAVCQSQESAIVRTVFLRHINSHPKMSVQGLSLQECDQPGQVVVVAEIYSSERNDKYMNDMVSRISIEPSVTAVSWERVR